MDVDLVARYNYGPYGRITTLANDGSGTEAAFGFTGFLKHDTSGLNLTLYRAYDPELGRWISRDPIGADGGLNLYGYVGNDPILYSDPYGLKVFLVNRPIGSDGSGGAMPSWDNFSHTFVAVQDSNGVMHTYSWGNSANPNGWNYDQMEDLVAAFDAMDRGYAKFASDGCSLDNYIEEAFNYFNNPQFSHRNGWIVNNCKTEANTLIEAAQILQNLNGK